MATQDADAVDITGGAILSPVLDFGHSPGNEGDVLTRVPEGMAWVAPSPIATYGARVVYPDGDQEAAADVPTTVIYDPGSTAYDQGDFYDGLVSPSNLVVPAGATGIYAFGAWIETADPADSVCITLDLLVNGGVVASQNVYPSNVGVPCGVTVHTHFSLVTGDIVTARVTSAGGALFFAAAAWIQRLST
jgi:hypothetical protein